MALAYPSPLTIVREETGWSLGDLAAELKCDRSHLSRIERGEARASADFAKRVEAIFKKSVTRDQVLFPEEYPNFQPGKKKPSRSVQPQEAR